MSVALLCCRKIISSVGNWYSLLVVKWFPGEGLKKPFLTENESEENIISRQLSDDSVGHDKQQTEQKR